MALPKFNPDELASIQLVLDAYEASLDNARCPYDNTIGCPNCGDKGGGGYKALSDFRAMFYDAVLPETSVTRNGE